MTKHLFEKTIQWTLLAVTLLYVLTGLGITQFHIIEPATLGLLNKNVSLTIHDNLLIPFIILLVLHVAARPAKKIYYKRKRKSIAQ
jgi:hypothetical protein